MSHTVPGSGAITEPIATTGVRTTGVRAESGANDPATGAGGPLAGIIGMIGISR